MVCGAHVIVDVYPVFFPSLMLALKAGIGLQAWQIALLYATGPIVSGMPQLFFAWASDRLDTRLCGWFGLALGAVCISSIGYAQSFWSLWVLQILGMLGTGMFHPISAALAGHLGRRLRPVGGRAWGVSIFYTAGMVGGFAGAMLCTRISGAHGLSALAWLMIPGLITAAFLLAATKAITHRHENHRELHAGIPADEARLRWVTVSLLFFQNVLRFTVNTGLPVLFVIWAEARSPDSVGRATNLTGNLIAAMTVGMGLFGLLGQRLAPPGREKRPIIVLTVIGGVCVALTGFAGTHVGTWAIYLMAALSSIGFSAVVPTTISLAQRLLPGRTGLASGLMLGTAWSVSAVAPLLAQWFLGGTPIDRAFALPARQIDMAFVWFASLLAVAVLLTMAMPIRLLKRIADHQ